MTKPHALLRAGYPFFTTLGMRRVTTYPTDLVVGSERDVYTLNRYRKWIYLARADDLRFR